MVPPINFLSLLKTVFATGPTERWLTFLVDLPNERVPDTPAWRDRRTLAGEWFREMQEQIHSIPFKAVVLCLYENVGSNNNELPEACIVADSLPAYSVLPNGKTDSIRRVLEESGVVVALTQFSATAPLKILARSIPFKGATMPGFSRSMLPALGLDYERVNDRVLQFKRRMDNADAVSLVLSGPGTEYESYFDLRFRKGHASGGLMRNPGEVGNLPSGEAYIVPYEGEQQGIPSLTKGVLPVQFGKEIVEYRIEENRAVQVLSEGDSSEAEARKLREEPAYGNIAEVGMGVLGEWGIKAVGSTLLDEKLGLHIAFGRSEHFGGITGPSAFRDQSRVEHTDRVYVPSTQPMLSVRSLIFEYPEGKKECVIADDKYIV